MLAGARLAAEEINAQPSGEIEIELVPYDPAGDLQGYVAGANHLLVEERLEHVVGCYTSVSRKEVLPVFEKHDAMLWYPSHYEGFETSDNVVYSGAAPNQHIVPLCKHLLGDGRKRGWLIGSNYIWAWENNRIIREAMVAAGGEIVGERYCPLGETDLGHIIEQIVADKPDFIFTSLIGSSLSAFLIQLSALCTARGIDLPETMPVTSCSFSESDLPYLGDAGGGHIASAVYFSSVATDANRIFSEAWDSRFRHMGHASADAEATYTAVHMLAAAAQKAGGGGFDEVREAARGLEFDAPQGPIRIDPDNFHCWLRPRIARSRTDGTFEIISENNCAIQPDPYLTWTQDSDFGIPPTPILKMIK